MLNLFDSFSFLMNDLRDKKMRKEYSLCLHWKQGDDCLGFIEKEGDSVKGLIA